MSSGSLNTELSKKYAGVKLWILIGICVGAFIFLIMGILSMWIMFRRKSRKALDKYSLGQIPNVSKDSRQSWGSESLESVHWAVNDKKLDKMFVHLGKSKSSDADSISQCSSTNHLERACSSSQSGDEGSFGNGWKHAAPSYGLAMQCNAMPSPLSRFARNVSSWLGSLVHSWRS